MGVGFAILAVGSLHVISFHSTHPNPCACSISAFPYSWKQRRLRRLKSIVACQARLRFGGRRMLLSLLLAISFCARSQVECLFRCHLCSAANRADSSFYLLKHFLASIPPFFRQSGRFQLPAELLTRAMRLDAICLPRRVASCQDLMALFSTG